jgi:hypothetical protein
MALGNPPPAIQAVAVTLPDGQKRFVKNDPVLSLVFNVGLPVIYRAKGRKDGATSEIHIENMRTPYPDRQIYILPVMETPLQLQEAFARASGPPVPILRQPVKNAIRVMLRKIGL